MIEYVVKILIITCLFLFIVLSSTIADWANIRSSPDGFFYSMEQMTKDPRLHYLTSPSGKYLRQCKLPILYIIDYSVSDHYVDCIIDAAESWNVLANKEIFRMAGYNSIFESISGIGSGVVHIYFRDDPLVENILGLADIGSVALNGCMSSGEIYLYPRSRRSFYIFNNVVRHEMGHILGLAHNSLYGNLMSAVVNSNIDYIIPINDVEYKALNFYY